MELKYILAFAGLLAVISLLVVVITADQQEIALLKDHIGLKQKLESQLTKAIQSQYLPDLDAAAFAWTSANEEAYASLRKDGIAIEADSITTPWYTAVFDITSADGIVFSAMPGSVERDEVLVTLGQYYESNKTKVPGWSAMYRVNTTTHKVEGLTSSVIKNIAREHYLKDIDPEVYSRLGVSQDAIVGYEQKTLDTSYLPDRGLWLDVTEYKYYYKNTDFSSYLTIKSYVDAENQTVTDFEVVGPYFGSAG